MNNDPPSIDEMLPDLRSCGDEPERAVAATVRDYLGQVREYLVGLHQEGNGGQLVVQKNSDLMDRLVRRLFNLAEESLLADNGELERGLCVVAVGGFARREMSIHSDVDLLVAYQGELTPYVSSISERLQYWMWDAGLTVGCATRTPAETVTLGWEDNTVRTAVLSARFLCGDGEFFHEFSDAIRKELLPDLEEFMDAQLMQVKERHKRYGESAFLLQPNLKEGVGGLRDYHAAFWVARAAHPTTRDLEDFLHVGLLTESEMREYREALNFVWRTRNELHYRTRRCNDQMSFELQEALAEGLGYGVTGAAEGALPVERFMGDYYRHVRAIENYSELIMQLCRKRVRRDAVTPTSEEVEDGFRITDGELEIPHNQHLRERPVRMLSAFVVSQTHDVPLSRMARRMIRHNLDLIDDEYRRDPEAAQAFLDILSGENRVMRSLMTMNEEGVMVAYLPEWENILYRWQHVVYHTYTVDVHSIFLIEELRRLGKREYEHALPLLTELVSSVDDHAVLFIGCLYHDIAKGLGGDHSDLGVPRARALVERLGLSPERQKRVLFLVQHHLLMSHLAQRRDLSDPHLILNFAQTCGDRTNLRNLYLLTFADIRASSQDAWTDWKGQLLAELFERTAELLEVGPYRVDRAMEMIEARVEIRRDGARGELRGLGFSDAKISEYFEAMPRRYFISHTPRQIARHARVVMRFADDGVMSTSFREMRGDFTEFILCVKDTRGLYSKVAGVLTSLQLNILGAHVYTSREGFALEIYRLTTPKGGREEIEMAWSDFEKTLARVLRGEADVADMVASRRGGRPPRKLPSQGKASVEIANEESDFYTIVDVTADDRIGLLYDLTDAISRCDLSIYISKAATVLDQVTDTFYLKDEDRKKLVDPGRIEALRSSLLEAAERDPDCGSRRG